MLPRGHVDAGGGPGGRRGDDGGGQGQHQGREAPTTTPGRRSRCRRRWPRPASSSPSPGRRTAPAACHPCSTLLGGFNAAAGNPVGSFDGATRLPGTVRVNGWAIDPDTTGAIDVHVYVDGRFIRAFPAAASRPDVGAAFPRDGAHGYAEALPGVQNGNHTFAPTGSTSVRAGTGSSGAARSG